MAFNTRLNRLLSGIDCSQISTGAIGAACGKRAVAGTNSRVIIGNYSSIEREDGTTEVIDNVVTSLILSSPAYEFISYEDSTVGTTSLEAGTFMNELTHTAVLRTFVKNEDVKTFHNQILNATVFVIIDNKEHGEDHTQRWEIYGFQSGLRVTGLEATTEMTDGVVYELTLSSGSLSRESTLPLTVWAGTTADTETMLDSLVDAQPVPGDYVTNAELQAILANYLPYTPQQFEDAVNEAVQAALGDAVMYSVDAENRPVVMLKEHTRLAVLDENDTGHLIAFLGEYETRGETYKQLELGSTTTHTNLNTNADPAAGVRPSVDTPEGKKFLSYTDDASEVPDISEIENSIAAINENISTINGNVIDIGTELEDHDNKIEFLLYDHEVQTYQTTGVLSIPLTDIDAESIIVLVTFNGIAISPRYIVKTADELQITDPGINVEADDEMVVYYVQNYDPNNE